MKTSKRNPFSNAATELLLKGLDKRRDPFELRKCTVKERLSDPGAEYDQLPEVHEI